MNVISHQLLSLINVGICGRALPQTHLTEYDFSLLLEESLKQSVVGLVADGVSKCDLFKYSSQEVRLNWILYLQSIEIQNQKHKLVLGKIIDCFGRDGVSVAFMKGLIVGSRYPVPERRPCGDIDFVISKSDFNRALKLLDEIGDVDWGMIHEQHGFAVCDGIALEPHYKIHHFQNPKVDKVIERILQDVMPLQLVFEDVDGLKVPTFPPTVECVVLIGHLVGHIITEGAKLRQLVDFWMFMEKKYSEIDKKLLGRYLDLTKMKRAFYVIVRICEKFLGMSVTIANLSYTSAEIKFADKLMEDIMHSKNSENEKAKLLFRPLNDFYRAICRCVRFGFICPEEARWWPYSRVKILIWKVGEKFKMGAKKSIPLYKG